MNSTATEPGPHSAPAAPRVLVIGYGNTLRGDDAVGPLLSARLRQTIDSNRVLVMACHQLTPELASDLAACDRVIFIDASVDVPAGRIQCRPLAASAADATPLVHSLGPESLLALTRLVYGRQPQAFLVSVGGLRFDFGDARLSPPVAAAIEPALQQIRELIGIGPTTWPPAW